MTEADFLKHDLPEATEIADLDPSSPQRFFNREMSWLAFNWRVLEEAENQRVPLLERVRFLSISATNLDEFYTVRVAGLLQLARAGNVTPAADGLFPQEQLQLINANARQLMLRQQAVLGALCVEMDKAGINILSRDQLTNKDLSFLQDYFLEQVFPVLSPLAIDPAHPFPFIPNEGFSLALQMERIKGGKPLQALLPIPQQLHRFVSLPSAEGVYRFLPLEVLLLVHIDSMFPGY